MTTQPKKDSVDEIDQIMNEIEELQKSMADSQTTPPAKMATPKVDAVQEADAMAEFQEGRGETSLEETLAQLKDDEPSGPNLIDQAIAAEAGADEAAVSEVDTELLEEAESQALDQAIAEEEAKLIEEIENEKVEEPIMIHEAVRRQKKTASDSTGSVSVKLSGNMTLNLSYEFEGQDVTIGFSDGALFVQLTDGTEFKIPVRRNPLRKAA